MKDTACQYYLIFSFILLVLPFTGLTQAISSPETILEPGFGYDRPKVFDADRDGDLDILDFPYLYINDGKGQKQKMITLYDSNIEIETCVVEDLNKDKHKDIVTLNKSGEICIFMNTIKGFHKINQVVKLDYKPAEYADILVFDINSDGVLDLVIKSLQGPTVGYAGTKEQQFSYFRPFTDFAYNKSDVIGADINGDGIQEILTTQKAARSRSSSSNKDLIAFHYNKTGYTVSDTLLTLNTPMRDLNFFDMNKDGYQDLVFTIYSAEGRSIHWMKRNPNGSLGKEFVFLKDLDNTNYQLGDYDSDGDLDVVYFSSFNRTDVVQWAKNNGNGTFSMDCKSLLPDAVQTEQFIFEDFDGDKVADVFYCEADGEKRPRYNMVLMNKNGQSKSKNTWVVNGECQGLHLADLNGDGFKDIIGYYQHEVFYSLVDQKGNFSEVTQLKINVFQIGSVSSSDLDNDGKMDLIISSDDRGNGVLGWYKNLGNMRFSELKPIHSGQGRLIAFECIDFDRDGFSDIIVNYWEDKVYGFYSYRNEGNAAFTETKTKLHQVSYPEKLFPRLAVFDMDLDGIEDVLDMNSGLWYNFDNSSNWQQHSSDFKTDIPNCLLKANMDGDSLKDALLFSVFKMTWFEQDSLAQWKMNTFEKVGSALDNLSLGDMTGDGLDDLVCLDGKSEMKSSVTGEIVIGTNHTLVIMKNKGDGTYLKVPLFPINNLSGLELHDIDNDGDLDIIASDKFWNNYGIRVWKNLLKN